MKQKLKNDKSSAKDAYVFTLKNINTEKVDQQFGISMVSNINTVNTLPHNSTKISDLSLTRNTPEIISFIDEAKKTHKCSISMVDLESSKEFQTTDNVYNCFWCRHKISSTVLAIGCPIKYVPSQILKTYYSEISRDNYTIKENITVKKAETMLEKNNSLLALHTRNYYLTDGIYCSFNCCMSFIQDNKHNSLYSMSEMLLLKMYHDIYPTIVVSIDEAPHWRKLLEYGGDLTIEKFRESFNKIEHKPHGIMFKSCGMLFEEKLKF